MKKYYDAPKDNAAFDRCIDVMVRLMQKYGPQLLEQMKENQQTGNADADHAAQGYHSSLKISKHTLHIH